MKIIVGRSGFEAKQLIAEHSDAAAILLDVSMETDYAGLEVVSYIRNKLGNSQVRIILRTGQAGQLNESEVFEKHDINDFLEKADLTSRRLKISIKCAFRAFRIQSEIEDARQREVALRHSADSANRAKSAFLANMSHELRSPVTSIKSGMDIIGEVIKDPNASQEDKAEMLIALSYAKNSLNRLLGLLNGILDLARLESGMMSFDFQPGNLLTAVEDAEQDVDGFASF